MTAAEAPIESRAELNAELRALLVRAYDEGIEVKGGFECESGAAYPDWDVVVTEIERDR